MLNAAIVQMEHRISGLHSPGTWASGMTQMLNASG
jgi:hypothetical protein